MTTALRVENISKQYRIYAKPGDRLKESLTRGRMKRHREFWALKDISFEIEKGTTTGIIGPNGSGKSTLLQIITGTLEPTHGSVSYDGRIAALLELGAGFDPEFTGIENIFMNASLMGFSRRDTEKLLPDIERFAEIGDFIHQPVKTYSSGMYVRLAFSIAISVEPNILIIDEALAVGDGVFQHRCLRRMQELQERGTTILFVSHDLAAVRALCSRAILLNGGRLVKDGKSADVLNRYQQIIMARERAYEESSTSFSGADKTAAADNELPPLRYVYRHGDGRAEILGAELIDPTGRCVQIVESREPLMLRLSVRANQDLDDLVIGFLIKNRYGIHVYGTNTNERQIELGAIARGEILELSFEFECSLGIDEYSISLAAHSAAGESYDWLDGVIFFRVTSLGHWEGVANLNAKVAVRQPSGRRQRTLSAVNN